MEIQNSNQNKWTFNRWVFLFSLVTVLGGGLCFGVMQDRATQMGLIIAAGFIGMAFSSLDKLDYFKGPGIEAKMRQAEKAVIETQTLLNETKMFVEPVLEILITEMTWANRYGGVPEPLQWGQQSKILKIIEGLKIKSPPLDSAICRFISHKALDELNILQRNLSLALPRKEESFSSLFKYWPNTPLPSLSEVKDAVSRDWQTQDKDLLEKRDALLGQHLKEYENIVSGLQHFGANPPEINR